MNSEDCFKGFETFCIGAPVVVVETHTFDHFLIQKGMIGVVTWHSKSSIYVRLEDQRVKDRLGDWPFMPYQLKLLSSTNPKYDVVYQ